MNKSVPYTFTFTCNKKTKIKFYKTITYEAYPFKVFLIHQYDKLMFWYQCLCVCLQFYICVTALKHLKITFEFPLQSSFSKLSDASPTSQLILQPFHRFTYITAHSPTLPLLHLCHSSFSNSSFASPTSQFILQHFRCFTYVTAHSPTLPSLHLQKVFVCTLTPYKHNDVI